MEPDRNFISITDFSLPELAPYACTAEVQLLRYFEPKPGVFVAESPRVIGRALDGGFQPLSLLVEKTLAEKQAGEIIRRCGDIPVYTGDAEVLVRITGYRLTQGVLCLMRRKELPGVEEVCAKAERIAVLEDITNPTNVGAVFRSAAALNFDAVLLTDDCCDPLYRRSARVSMGTVFQIPWTFLREKAQESAGTDSPGSDSGTYVKKLKDMGFATSAMALCEDSVGIDDPRLMREKKLAVILGNEGNGLKEATIRACDYTVKIPMAHGVDSLNVAAASAVAFWQLGRR